MKTTFNARHVNLTDDLKVLIEKKLSKFDKFFDNAEATAKFSKVRENECLEITIQSKGVLFRAEKTCKSFQMAIDECVDAIERQIRKYKTKLANKFKSGAADQIKPYDEPVEEEVVRTKTFVVEPMTTEDAIIQMNLLGHDFYIFKDAITEEIKVVYKRKLNTYGVLIPKDKD